MVSDVSICNLALSHLGDDATVASINPPEGSAQAEHCAQFYPIARDQLLEMHDWKFCTRRIAGAAVDVPLSSGWAYAYAKPSGAISIIAVVPPEAPNDYSVGLGNIPGYSAYGNLSTVYDEIDVSRQYVPQDYALETAADGSEIILTNQPEAVIRYVVRITDASKFSPLFVTALSRLLASMLAGPVLKGDVGRAEGKGQYQIFLQLFGMSTTSDTNQQQIKPKQSVPWLQNR